MKNQGIKTIITVFSMFTIGIITWFFPEPFFEFVYGQFDDVNVQLVSTELLGQFKQVGDYTAALAMLPLLLLFSDYMLSKEPKIKLLITVIVILSSGIGLMFLHISMLKAEVLQLDLLPGIQNTLSISSIHAGWYLGIGFISGTLASNLFFLFMSAYQSRNN